MAGQNKRIGFVKYVCISMAAGPKMANDLHKDAQKRWATCPCTNLTFKKSLPDGREKWKCVDCGDPVYIKG